MSLVAARAAVLAQVSQGNGIAGVIDIRGDNISVTIGESGKATVSSLLLLPRGLSDNLVADETPQLLTELNALHWYKAVGGHSYVEL